VLVYYIRRASSIAPGLTCPLAGKCCPLGGSINKTVPVFENSRGIEFLRAVIRHN
jgi:hypothetical protein